MNNLKDIFGKLGGALEGGAAKAIIAAGALTFGGISLYNNGVYTVDVGHRAILFNRISGIGSEIISEGIHFKLPWFERPIVFDARSRPHVLTSLTGSRDLQMVNITVRVLSRPNVQELPTIYRTLGVHQDEKVLPSIVNEVLKSVVAQYNAAQLITQRDLVSRSIREQLTQRAKDFHITLDDVSITHLSFSQEYANAVESKQVAQQEAERARYHVMRALEDKKSTIIRAQGEAKSAQLIGEALKENPGYLDLRRIEIAKDVANTMCKSNNRVMLDSSQLFLNLSQEK